MERTQAATGTVVVQNLKTGQILALANRPTFNPNLAAQPAAKLQNHAVSDVYEPGSTFKSGYVFGRPQTKSDPSRRTLRLPERTDRYQRHAHSRQQALPRVYRGRSAGAIQRRGSHQARAAAGGRTILQIHSRLRFRVTTPAWNAGRDPRPDQAREPVAPKIDRVNLAIGQEIGVTPLQLVSMVSTIANDGVWTAPSP